MPKISLIIPTLNEEKYLPKLLESIRKQDFTDYEIIIADAGSTDKTKKIAKRFRARVVKGGMPGPGRNRGAEAARGELLFFFDADVKLPRGFLEKAHSEMQERFLDLASCEFRPLSSLYVDKVMHELAYSYIKLGQFTSAHAPGFCIFISRRLFFRIGGFDESITLAEDHDLVRRASKLRPLRLLNSVYIKVSVRRLRKEGRLLLAGKYLKAEYFRMTKGEIRDGSVEYEFADFSRNLNKPIEKRLHMVERQINRMNRDYNRLKKNLSEAGTPKLAIKRMKNNLESARDSLAGLFIKRKIK